MSSLPRSAPTPRSLTALLALSALLASAAWAQRLELPARSPAAKVSQTVGLTDISVEYSSPAVRGRTIWGGVVPYGEVWRAGANQATQITFSKDVLVGETPVPAGTYAFFALPTPTTWTLILNKELRQFGAFSYRKEADLLRLTVTPQAIPPRERLAFLVQNFTDDTASLDLEWEKVRVSLPLQLKTTAQARANIQAASDGQWATLNSAARWYLDQKDYAQGLAFVERSLKLKEDWFNLWVKAQLLAGSGKRTEAVALAEKAQALGQKTPDDFFAAKDVKEALAAWKGKP
jgi:hypothetical protein